MPNLKSTIISETVKRFEKTRFCSDEGGSSFECSDYEGMYVELKEFIKSELSTALDTVKAEVTKLKLVDDGSQWCKALDKVISLLSEQEEGKV